MKTSGLKAWGAITRAMKTSSLGLYDAMSTECNPRPFSGPAPTAAA